MRLSGSKAPGELLIQRGQISGLGLPEVNLIQRIGMLAWRMKLSMRPRITGAPSGTLFNVLLGVSGKHFLDLIGPLNHAGLEQVHALLLLDIVLIECFRWRWRQKGLALR